MKQLLAIGEALIDFAPEETGKELKDVSAFKPKVGGAPASSHSGGHRYRWNNGLP